MFNLVYETNVASCRIWDALGFKRIGRVKGCGNLRSHPSELVDAIIYGRDLGPDGEDYVSEERFDKIRYYLKHGKYPNGADRAEKSRLRSAATHYKLLPAENGDSGEDNERLMLKDKEVVSDPQKQYEIARVVHANQHGGINKTTATIAEKYHWVRIKETVSLVIKNCPDCKDTAAKVPVVRPAVSNGGDYPGQGAGGQSRRAAVPDTSNSMMDQLIHFDNELSPHPNQNQSFAGSRNTLQLTNQNQQSIAPVAPMRALEDYSGIPLDPQIMQGTQTNPHNFVKAMRQAAEYSQSDRNTDGQFDTDMNIDDGQAARHADTRMATEQHVGEGNDPMTYQDPQGVLHRGLPRSQGQRDGSFDSQDNNENEDHER